MTVTRAALMTQPPPACPQQGFILLTVVMTLTVLATLSFMLSRQSAINAGGVVREHEPDAARYVAEAGYSHAVWQLNRLNCSGYTDIAATSFGTDSYTVTLTDNSGNPITAGSPANILATGTLASSNSYRLDRQAVKIYQYPTQQLVLQPTANALKDTFLDEVKPDRNYGIHPLLRVDATPIKAYYTLIEFDLSSLPSGIKILSANLDLYINSVNTNTAETVNIKQVISLWEEGDQSGNTGLGATWTNRNSTQPWSAPGGDFDNTIQASQTIGNSASGWVSWDVTALISRWVSGQANNYGMALVPGSANTSIDFESSDSNNVSNHPKLNITYACECGQTCNTGTCVNGTYADYFTSTAFNNSNGSLIWSGDWLEADDSGVGPNTGKAQISASELRLNGPLTTTTLTGGVTVYYPSLAREMDLSGASAAILSFNYRTSNGVDAGIDSAVIEISSDGGTNWNILEDFIGLGPSASGAVSYDISAYIAANTRIRLRLNAAYESLDEFFYVDNLTVTVNCSQTAPDVGLLAHWKLDDGSGLSALDSVGGHNGQLNGGIWTSGKINGGLALDGSNWINVAHDNTLSLLKTFSFSAWINANSFSTALNGYQTVLNKGLSDGSDSNYWFGVWQNELLFGFWNGGVWQKVFTSGLNLQSNNWYHIAMNFDNVSHQVRLYLNGSEVLNASMSPLPTATTEPLLLGRTPLGEYWPGILDDIRIYDRILGAGEINTLAAGSGAPPPPAGNCNGTYLDNFNAIDYSGNNGTLSWTADWAETGETTSPTGGDIQVVNQQGSYELMVRDDGQTIMREADLSQAGAATLSFDYWRKNLQGTAEYVAVEVSYNGGATWSELVRFTGDADDSAYSSASYMLDAGSLSANTRIRFRTPASGMKNSNQVLFDNIQIQCSP